MRTTSNGGSRSRSRTHDHDHSHAFRGTEGRRIPCRWLFAVRALRRRESSTRALGFLASVLLVLGRDADGDHACNYIGTQPPAARLRSPQLAPTGAARSGWLSPRPSGRTAVGRLQLAFEPGESHGCGKTSTCVRAGRVARLWEDFNLRSSRVSRTAAALPRREGGREGAAARRKQQLGTPGLCGCT